MIETINSSVKKRESEISDCNIWQGSCWKQTKNKIEYLQCPRHCAWHWEPGIDHTLSLPSRKLKSRRNRQKDGYCAIRKFYKQEIRLTQRRGPNQSFRRQLPTTSPCGDSIVGHRQGPAWASGLQWRHRRRRGRISSTLVSQKINNTISEGNRNKKIFWILSGISVESDRTWIKLV